MASIGSPSPALVLAMNGQSYGYAIPSGRARDTIITPLPSSYLNLTVAPRGVSITTLTAPSSRNAVVGMVIGRLAGAARSAHEQRLRRRGPRARRVSGRRASGAAPRGR